MFKNTDLPWQLAVNFNREVLERKYSDAKYLLFPRNYHGYHLILNSKMPTFTFANPLDTILERDSDLNIKKAFWKMARIYVS